jgi:DNA-binding XRE family transcriptional regulator
MSYTRQEKRMNLISEYRKRANVSQLALAQKIVEPAAVSKL